MKADNISLVLEKGILIISTHTRKEKNKWFGRILPSGSKKKTCFTFPFGRVFSKVWMPFSYSKIEVSLATCNIFGF